jgi:hypothetical protein
MPLGAQMVSSAFTPGPSTAATGAWPSPPVRRRRGPREGDSGPFCRPLEAAHLQEKRLPGPGVHALWGRNGLDCLISSRHKYCPNGGMTLAHHRRPARPRRGGCRAEGSTIGMTAPFSGPKKCAVCRQKCLGSVIRAFWGQQWTRLPSRGVCRTLEERSRRSRCCSPRGRAAPRTFGRVTLSTSGSTGRAHVMPSRVDVDEPLRPQESERDRDQKR